MKYENRKRVDELVRRIERLENQINNTKKVITQRGYYSAYFVIEETSESQRSTEIDKSTLDGEALNWFVNKRVSELQTEIDNCKKELETL